MRVYSTDSLHQKSTRWVYDAWGRPIKKIESSKDGSFSRTTTWSYIVSSQENAVIITTPEKNQSKIIYSATGKKLSTWHRFFNQTDKPAAGRSNWIQDTQTKWGKLNKPVSQTVWHAQDAKPGGVGKAIPETTHFGYDLHKRLIWVKNPDKSARIVFPDDARNETIAYGSFKNKKTHATVLKSVIIVEKRNILGKIVASYLLPINPSATRSGKTIYSAKTQKKLNILKAHVLSVNHLNSSNAVGLIKPSYLLRFVHDAIDNGEWLTHSSRVYDGFGRVISQTKGNKGFVTRWKYDKTGNVFKILPDSQVIYDKYNVFGKKINRLMRSRGGMKFHSLGTRHYGNSGNLLYQEDEYGHRIHYFYDQDGRLIKKTTPPDQSSPTGHTFTYHYNSAGVIAKYLDGHLYAKYVYNPHTHKLTDKYDKISHTHYTYSLYFPSMPVKVKVTPADIKDGIVPEPGIKYPSYTKTYTYNRYGVLTGMTDGMGNYHFSTHDKYGRILTKQVVLPGHKKGTLLEKIAYRADGKVASITNGLGIKRTFTYNQLGLPKVIRDARNGAFLEQLSYTWDPNMSNITTITREEPGSSATQKYTYDKMNNLLSMSCSQTGNNNMPSRLCPRDTDIEHHFSSGPPVIMHQDYTFDRWNNIKTVVEKLAADNHVFTKKTSYQYDGEGKTDKQQYDPNRLVGYQVRLSNDKISEAPATLDYDSMGRVIKDSNGNLYHYNAFGQEDIFTNKKTHNVTHYFYNSDGEQIAEQPFSAKNVPLQAPLYLLYDGHGLVGEKQRVKGVDHTLSMLEGVAHSKDGVITGWYLHDYRNDVIKLYDNNGKELSSKVYSPYGMTYDLDNPAVYYPGKPSHFSSKAWINSKLLGFGGVRTDPASGDQFLGKGYRAYSPIYRHFMSKDSFSPFDIVNGYGFVSNNPIVNIDPTGHFPTYLGYIFGALTIAISVAIGIALPIALVAAGSSGVALAGSLALGIANTALGITSGSLGIASTAHPEIQSLREASDEVGIAQAILGVIPMTAAESMTLPLNITEDTLRSISILRRGLKALIIASTSSGNAIWILGGASSIVSLTKEEVNGGQSGKSSPDNNPALDILNYVFMGSSALSFGISLLSLSLSSTEGFFESRILNSKAVNRTAGIAEKEAEQLDKDTGSEHISNGNHNGHSNGNSINPNQENFSNGTFVKGTASATEAMSGGNKVRNFGRVASFRRVLSTLLGVAEGAVHISSGKNEVQSQNHVTKSDSISARATPSL